MPIHDWTRVRANRFHHFHQDWTVGLSRALNDGRLPQGYFAMVEQRAGGPEPDVITLALPVQPGHSPGGVALAEKPVQTRIQYQSDAIRYARKANRLTVRHPDGNVVAIIEIVSPGNKDSKHAVRTFTRKAVEYLLAGINLLIVDLFPPSRRDPQGLHQLIWDRIKDDPYELPAGKPLTVAAYSAGEAIRAFVENVGVGDPLPDLPIFLDPERYIPCPLEATYLAAWESFPQALRQPLELPAT